MNNRSKLIRELLSGLTEKKLEQLVNLRKSIKKPIPTPRNNLDQSINQSIKNISKKYSNIKFVIDKPVPALRKTVKQMVEECENNIIPPPIEFRDDYKPFPAPRTKKPVASPRTKIG